MKKRVFLIVALGALVLSVRAGGECDGHRL